MKLLEAYQLSNLQAEGQQPVERERIKTGIELAREIFAEAEERGDPFLYMTPETWSKKWLPSKKFYLTRMPLNAFASPCEPRGRNLVLKKVHAREDKPVVIDSNKNNVGAAFCGYTPERITVDGKHRVEAAHIRGDSHIWAWVGEDALESLEASRESYKRIKAGGPGSGRHAGDGSYGTYKGSGKTFVGYHHHTEDEDGPHPYNIIEGAGPNGGQWAAHEAYRSGGGRELAVFDSQKEAVEHSHNSNS